MLTQNIRQVNKDLQINRTYINPNQVTQSTNPTSIYSAYHLMQALKKRNQVYSIKYDPIMLPEIPQSVRQLKNATIRNIRDRGIEREIIESRGEVEAWLNNDMQWGKFMYINHEEYLDEHQEYLVQSLVNKSFTTTTVIDKVVKNSLINKLKGVSDVESSNVTSKKSMKRIEKEGQTNRSTYHEFVKRKVLANQTKMSGFDQFQLLSGPVAELWHIISHQIKSYEYAVLQNRPNPWLALPLCSIAFVESKFRHELPTTQNEKQISQFMRKRYVISSSRTLTNFQISEQGQLTWSIPYSLYRAGLSTQTSICLTERGKIGYNIKKYVTKFEESLIQFEPTIQNFQEAYLDDAFYSQLVSILKGVSRFDQRLCQIGTIDFVWVVLKSISIYGDNAKKNELEQVSQALLQHFLQKKQQKQTPIQSLKHFLYLTQYHHLPTLYKCLPKQHSLSIDDFIHISLVLLSNPQILTTNQQQIIKSALVQQLICYITILLMGAQKQFVIFYLLEIPVEKFQGALRKIFGNWGQFGQVDLFFVDGGKGWGFVKHRYQAMGYPQVFQQAIYSLFTQLIGQISAQQQSNLIQSAQTLLTTPQIYLKLMLQLQCKLIKGSMAANPTSLEQKRIKKLNSILSTTVQTHSQKDLDLAIKYWPIISFLDDYEKLVALHLDRNVVKIQQFVKGETYIRDLPLLYGEEDDNLMSILWNKLQEFQGMDIFFRYVNIVLQSVERIWSMKGQFDKVKDYKQSIKYSLEKIRRQREFNISGYINSLNL